MQHDDQPMVHEIGNRTYIVADVDPLDLDGVRTMQVGTALWAVALILLLPVLRPAAGRRAPVVAVDVRRRLRSRPGRLGPLPQAAQGAPGAAMTRTTYYTATTLDGFIADEHDSLAWLFEQQIDEGGAGDYSQFIADIGAIVMGATTYAWLGAHQRATGESWAYDVPCWVFSHREHEPLGDGIHFVAGDLSDLHPAIVESAGGRDLWVVGGGDLAGQFADLGLLDRVVVSIAPVTLGAGRPLFPRRHDLKLVDLGRNGDFAVATYDVLGRRSD